MRSEKKGVEFGKNRQVGVIRNWEPVNIRDPRFPFIKRDPYDKIAAAFCDKRSPHSPPG